MSLEFTEKKIAYRDHNLMSYELGTGDEPVFLISGGPGPPSLYLREPHKSLTSHGFKLYTWDQLGCGQSDKPTDSALWTVERYLEETEWVREKLGLKKFHLLGHAWGGILAMEYALLYPQYLKSLVLTNITANLALMQKGLEKHKSALGPETERMITYREIEGTTNHPEYEAASTLLMYRHVCRLETWPEVWSQSAHDCNSIIFEFMFGPHLFNCSGTLSSYNRCKDLEKIKTPTLILHGEYDEVTPECAQEMHILIKESKIKIFREASHLPFFETPDLYFKELISFLKNHS